MGDRGLFAAAAPAPAPAPAPAVPATTAAAPAPAPAALLVTNAITEAENAIAQAGVVLGPAVDPGYADDEGDGEAILDFGKKLSTAPFQFKAFSRKQQKLHQEKQSEWTKPEIRTAVATSHTTGTPATTGTTATSIAIVIPTPAPAPAPAPAAACDVDFFGRFHFPMLYKSGFRMHVN